MEIKITVRKNDNCGSNFFTGFRLGARRNNNKQNIVVSGITISGTYCVRK